ncbi:hypothetical protein L1D32_17375 [Shewanella insulae]|uniref:Uncharacterized protein n=1 Tax=Shewanella insulae TaxID=2681496 RepID=A0A6L7HWL2_9GAMM|nr:hypothetical protein [Shewanella insulae]MCG9712063.1 hypothetical protein [Shewanella insulae]MCG9739939.1 hypothetical protein [Shewanella insulae]MCG9754103.1 hypothetical protein [Shewanella insulae]MXR68737.1 hypothetical protein [Shewanella insulae]
MINFKTVFAIALLSASTAATADEIVIDTTDLHAAISAQLAEGLEQMQQDLNEDLNAILVAQKDEQTDTSVSAQRAE